MTLLLQKEGIFTTVQDLGRNGFRRFGVGPGGAMDRTAARLANLLLGNDDDAPVLEFHFPAPEIGFETRCRFALAGADFSPELDGRRIQNWRTYEADAASVLRFAKKTFGRMCYLAVEDGLIKETPERTHRLTKGQRLKAHLPSAPASATPTGRALSRSLIPPYSAFPTVRIIAGAEYEHLTDDSRAALEASPFSVTRDSDRMGFRLCGPSLQLSDPVEMISSAVNFGTIQLLPDRQLIILMADHQTTGGYPHIGHVTSVDLPLVAQLEPGDKMTFELVGIRAAEQLARNIESELQRLKTAVSFGRYW